MPTMIPAIQETMALNIRDVPVDLQRRFKAHCVAEGSTMRDKIIELMRRTVQGAAPAGHHRGGRPSQ